MKKILIYFKNQALCESVEEAINFINSQKGITCNPAAEKEIVAIFADRPLYRGKREVATTGCGNARIYVYDSLGDTLEAHNAAYEIKRDTEKQERIRIAKEAVNERMSELSEKRTGLYSISISDIKIDGFRMTGNDRPKYKDFSMVLHADSGADAYEKASLHIEKTLPNELNTPNFTYLAHSIPVIISSSYYFRFLGAENNGFR